MSYPNPLPAWAVERKRSRQYAIGPRRSRQRLAQALAAGVPPARAAAVERRGEAEVLKLIEDEGFAALIEHYRALADLSEVDRIAALRGLALDLLELALRAGDVRAAVFFAYEELHGRDPAQRLAETAARLAGRPAERGRPLPERRLPRRAPSTVRREADFAWCAATQPTPADAAALAAAEAARLPARVAETGRRLARTVLAEAEREGTAQADPLTQTVETFARAAHDKGGAALTPAAVWQERREAFGKGRPGAPHRTALDRRSDFGLDPRVKHGDDGEGVGVVASSAMSEGASASAQNVPASARNVPALAQNGPALEPPGIHSSWSGLTRPSRTMPAQGGHPEHAAAGTAAPSGPPDGPAAPPILPDWLDQVPGADRARFLVMSEADRAQTLCVWARFYGFDTS